MAVHYGGTLDTLREFKSLDSPLRGPLDYLLCVYKKSLSLLRLTKSLSHLRPYGGLLQLGLTWVWQTLWWPPLRGQEVSASSNRVFLQLGSTWVWQTLWWPPLRRQEFSVSSSLKEVSVSSSFSKIDIPHVVI